MDELIASATAVADTGEGASLAAGRARAAYCQINPPALTAPTPELPAPRGRLKGMRHADIIF
jgi:hypothetical protein